ncbi:MAG: extracellular solute-binding protein [Chlamydiota bacterium]
MPITLLHSLGGDAGIHLENIIQKYNKTHEYQINSEVVLEGYAAAANAALEKPRIERPNIILAPEFMTGKLKLMAAQGEMIPVASLINEERLNDIAKIVKTTFGEYALPLNPACGVLYMNRTALAKIGKAPNWAPATFEEMVEASREMIKAGAVKHGFTCAWPQAYFVEVPLAQQNLPLVLPNNGEDGEGVYNFSQMQDHILNLWHLRKEGVVLPPALKDFDAVQASFAAGDVGFFMQGSGHSKTVKTIAETNGFESGCSALPTLTAGQVDKYAFPLGGAALWVMNTDEKDHVPGEENTLRMIDEVRSFLEYFSSPEVQREWHEQTMYVPVSMTVLRILREEGFYETHPVHKAVVDQTIGAPLGEYSFGIKTKNYSQARSEIYPLIYECIHLEGSEEDVKQTIAGKLMAFDDKWSVDN